MAARDDSDDLAAPAPRETATLIGHAAAEKLFLDSFRSGRLPHAWLIAGPEGIGKATLAFRIARFVLAEGEAGTEGGVEEGGLFGPEPLHAGERTGEDMDIGPSSPVFRRVAAGGHPDLMTLARGVDPKSGRPRSEIVVDDVRAVSQFLHMTPAESRWRVVVVDSVDEMNRNAANALLKILEEPPAQSLLLLVSHAPGKLLPTIRSRCRRLGLGPLSLDQVRAVLAPLLPDAAAEEIDALARLSEGSPGRALRLATEGGVETYREMLAVLSELPRLDVPAVHKLGDRLARSGGEAGFRTALDLLSRWIVRLVRFATEPEAVSADLLSEGEAQLLRRLAAEAPLDQWVEVWEKITRLAARADAVNLDRKQVVLSAFFAMESTARG